MAIHPTAVIGQKAQLSGDIEIGPYAIVEDNVVIGKRAKIYAQAQILANTAIGDDCEIHMGAIIGGAPQIRDNTNTRGRLIIGQRNIFREYATIHRSSQKENATTIGNDNYFMGFSHLAHDCHVGNNVTICNGALIAGHVTIEDYAFISGNVTVHQFCRIGKLAMIGGLARVSKDVPPYMLVKGDSQVWAINSVGIKRLGLELDVRGQIKQAFKILYRSGLNVKRATEQIQKQFNSPEIRHLIIFISRAQRGICAYRKTGLWTKLRPTRLFQINKRAQEPLALVLLLVVMALIAVFLTPQIREKIQCRYRQLMQRMLY